MNPFLVFIILLVVYIIVDNAEKKKRKKKKKEKEDNSNTSKDTEKITNFPYRKKYLLTKTEYTFYNELRKQCDQYSLHICPKVRLEDIAEVTDKENLNKYRGYIKSRHVDFIITDNKLNVLAGIELDDSSHNNYKAAKTDNFKNGLFNAINIPLFRVKVANYYEHEIKHIIQNLEIDTKVTKPCTTDKDIIETNQS